MSIFNESNTYNHLTSNIISITSDTDQINIGDSNLTTIDCITETERTLTIPDSGDSSFVLSDSGVIDLQKAYDDSPLNNDNIVELIHTTLYFTRLVKLLLMTN